MGRIIAIGNFCVWWN